MRRFLPCLLLLGLVGPARADGPSLLEARKRWLHGNYDEARQAYETLQAQPAHQAAAAVGLSRCWESVGEYDRALTALDGVKADPAIHARRAELLYLRGRWTDAEKAAEEALALQKDQLLARWVRAAVWRDRGDLKPAEAEFRWFVRTYSDRLETDAEIRDPDQLLLVGQAAIEHARGHGLADEFKTVLTEIYGDLLKQEKDYWPAEYQSALLLLEKYNRPEALDALDKALKINPSAAQALAAKGQIALQKYEIKQAETFAEQALAINPRLPDALRLKADIALVGSDTAEALKHLDAARQVNPRDERTLGRIAGCFVLQKKQAEFDALAAEVEKHNGKPALFYFELADRLDSRRRYDAAERYLKKALALRPNLAGASNSLGLLYMRLGREKEARTVLDRAFEADPFNVEVSNTLKVLRHLDGYETLKTEHFELRFDPRTDLVLARYLADYLEQVYTELAGKFNYRPEGPILLEVFNSHQMFSGRVVGLPDLHTIGACTGKMVAMVSPRGRGVGKPFNWGRVVRHELVHIFNLEQTAFQCPHWLTEGLAVGQEGFARPKEWNQLLRERVPAGELMNLDNIQLGFIRPRSPDDWHMAYCQSQLYVEYLQQTAGPEAVGALLAAYRDGLETAEAIQQVCKIDQAAFEKGYRTHLDGVVAGLGGASGRKSLSLSELKDLHARKPDDNDVAAQLAEQYLHRGLKKEARELVDRVRTADPGEPLACYVLARLLMAAGDKEARKVLEKARGGEPKVQLLLGQLYFEDRDFDRAARAFEQGRQAEPLEPRWLTELARVYTQTKDRDRLIAVLRDLAPADADDADVPRRLAGLLLEAGLPAEAERFARQALEVDLLDRETQDLLLAALDSQMKQLEAARLRRMLGR